ncbi:hypothetical protein [Streptomyces sp. CH-036]|uniref:hypothetical protein n=1 Tax=Streptomyces sp. CH-036 TaxID=3406733 RepID=UPI003C72CD9B
MTHQLADYLVDGEMSDDLAGISSNATKYPPHMLLLMQPFVRRATWGLDRFTEFFNGSKTPARRDSVVAGAGTAEGSGGACS